MLVMLTRRIQGGDRSTSTNTAINPNDTGLQLFTAQTLGRFKKIPCKQNLLK